LIESLVDRFFEKNNNEGSSFSGKTGEVSCEIKMDNEAEFTAITLYTILNRDPLNKSALKNCREENTVEGVGSKEKKLMKQHVKVRKK
jgi:hypothetical protein